ncbi:hypothetical protein TSAR_005010 [Trichomalopsis sarcophagae]|uniref:Uncharacterized protein n=1 Tax=Trichomalopsis sarcophagae TaxID=543379 RepID=A0A232FC84_9HYME|nr:hypothetical protein TSAR_005010 [Trichomalopsis sarcophagae]
MSQAGSESVGITRCTLRSDLLHPSGGKWGGDVGRRTKSAARN